MHWYCCIGCYLEENIGIEFFRITLKHSQTAALSYAPEDPSLENLLEKTSVPVTIETELQGVRFLYKPFSSPEAQQMFRDQTGRPGPADWELGRPPDGLEDMPVGGISWYEAAAYCNFLNKELPTIYHWRRATGLNREIYTDIHRMSNFSGKGPAQPGQYAGITRYGAYDMA